MAEPMGDQTYRSFPAGLRAGVPFAFAGLILATSFGVLAEPVIGAVPAIAMSLITFAGSAQFASVAVLGGGGDAAAAILAGILLNARYLPMGIALAPWLRGGPFRRAATGQAMIDASWAMAVRPGGRMDPAFMLGATLPSLPCWVGGTALGVAVGGGIGDPSALGIDAIFPAFFLALLISGEMSAPRAWTAALAGALIALVLLPIAPPGVPIIAASAAALLGLGARGAAPAVEAEQADTESDDTAGSDAAGGAEPSGRVPGESRPR